jgi:hypothetical protein
MWFMQAHGALQRGISVLMIDGPGQGGTLRRHGITNRFDYEVPIGRCIDYLATRSDVDMTRIAVCGSSLGGYYAARSGCYEHRLAACISHGAIWSVTDLWGNATEEHGLAEHIKWVFGARSMKEAKERRCDYDTEQVLINWPFCVDIGQNAPALCGQHHAEVRRCSSKILMLRQRKSMPRSSVRAAQKSKSENMPTARSLLHDRHEAAHQGAGALSLGDQIICARQISG